MKLILKENKYYPKVDIIINMIKEIEENSDVKIVFDNRIPNKYMLSINETIAIFTTYSDVISALNLLKKVGE